MCFLLIIDNHNKIYGIKFGLSGAAGYLHNQVGNHEKGVTTHSAPNSKIGC